MGRQALKLANLVKKYYFATFLTVAVLLLFIMYESSHRYRTTVSNKEYFILNLLPENDTSIASPRHTTNGLASPRAKPEATLEGEGRMFKLKEGVAVSCQQLFLGNMTEIKRIKGSMELKSGNGDDYLLEKTESCSWVRDSFNVSDYSTTLEKSFPIAFTFLVHNSAQQVVRLLRLLYRSHNQYIIGPDLKSSPTFVSIFRNIAYCMENIHVITNIIEVKWGHKSIMESQMQMYQDLLNLREKQVGQEKWRYVINLCGKELPLKSNHEIISRLIKLNGMSMIVAWKIPPNEGQTISRLRNQTIPFSLPLYKSMTYIALSFEFINFLFTNKSVAHLYKFFKTIDIPEEHFYATVYNIPHVPGGYNPELVKRNSFGIVNYFWRLDDYVEKYGRQCSGRLTHGICIVDVGDLNKTLEEGRNTLFHNKYFMEYDHVVMDCMEEKIHSRDKLEYFNDLYN